MADKPSNPESVKPDELDLPKDMQDLVNDAPIPDIYADEHGDTVPDLRIPDQPSLDVGESDGVNPYDTAKIHKK